MEEEVDGRRSPRLRSTRRPLRVELRVLPPGHAGALDRRPERHRQRERVHRLRPDDPRHRGADGDDVRLGRHRHRLAVGRVLHPLQRRERGETDAEADRPAGARPPALPGRRRAMPARSTRCGGTSRNDLAYSPQRPIGNFADGTQFGGRARRLREHVVQRRRRRGRRRRASPTSRATRTASSSAAARCRSPATTCGSTRRPARRSACGRTGATRCQASTSASPPRM